jgi:sulfur carrier protein ThiS
MKVFPNTGLCNKAEELEIALEEGSWNELIEFLQNWSGTDLNEIQNLMFLNNGHALDRHSDTVFADGDKLWLMSQISGG